jgi:chemotaxis protein CheD
MTTPPAPPHEIFLQPGQYAVGDAACRIRTVLGSCISIALWCPGVRLGAMSHCLLPSRGRTGVMRARGLELRGLDARYADEALHLMLHDLERRQVRAAQCRAKIFGGGNMFPAQRAAGVPVGRRNGEAARELLQAHGIEVVSESLFGDGHRQVVFDVATGDVWARQLAPSDAGAGPGA